MDMKYLFARDGSEVLELLKEEIPDILLVLWLEINFL